MKLDTTSLENAVRRLRDGLARCESEPTDEQIRDGLIRRFEFTYELSHKMLRRYLKEAAASPDEIGLMPFADLIRTGTAQGLLRGDWRAWRRFREMRARTSDTYDAKVASQVVAAIPAFLEEAEYLCAELQRRRVNILRANLPASTKAWVFGSRATGRARRYSDLDLAIDAGRPLMDEIASLTEAFSGSDLPYRVDLVDWHDIDDRWRRMILAERVALIEAARPDAAG